MATVDQPLIDRTPDAGGARTFSRDLAAGLALAAGGVGATWLLLDLPASYVLLGVALGASIAVLLRWTAPDDLPGPGIGPANRVTLGRSALTVPVLALALQLGTAGDAAHWWVIAVSTVVMVLDGVDGHVARRTGTVTRFGARFDMELDAALIMALSLLVWRSGKVGAWVLLIGLMRYGFVAAGRLCPALRRELPPSRRRRAVCVVQGVVLLVALGPIVPAGAAVAVAAAGLVALGYSFALDVRWAANAEGPEPRG